MGGDGAWHSLPGFSNFLEILLRENFKTPQFRPGPFMKKKDGNQVDIRTGKHWDTLKKSFRRETTTTTTECCVRPYVLPFVVTVSLPSTYRSSDHLFHWEVPLAELLRGGGVPP